MARRDSSGEKTAREIIVAFAIVGLVVLAIYDLRAEEAVNPLVYGILGGAIIGAENIVKLWRK
jgi:hypothetical protein